MRISTKSARFSILAAALATTMVSHGTAMAEDQVLTQERLDKVEVLGRLTGVGLFCGHLDDAVPLKEVVVEVADKHKMDETLRAQLGKVYHGNRDKAFNEGKEGGYECPKLSQFRAEALLARLNVVQAFD